MATILDEISAVHEMSFRLTESLAAALVKIEAGADKNARRQMITTLQLAKGEIQSAQRYIHAVVQSLDEERAVSQSKIMAPTRNPNGGSDNRIFYFRYSRASLVTSAVVASSNLNDEAKLQPDYTFENLHPAFSSLVFFPGPFGIQPFLIPLGAQPGVSVFVDGNEAKGPPTRTGFTTGAIAAVASKLLDYLDRGLVKKAVFIPRSTKYEDTTKVCALLPPQIQVINLLGLVPKPNSASDAMPRLIVCSVADIVNRTVVTKDCTHLVWDDYDGSDMVVEYGFTGLVDVVYRGPLRLRHTALLPKSSQFNCRIYSYVRTANCLDVQPFSMSREVEDFFHALPAGKNILVTTQTNAFIAGVTIVAHLCDVPLDADHLVVAEVPFTEDAIRQILRGAMAKIVTFVCQPTTPKSLIYQAMRAEGLEAPVINEMRTELSPSVTMPQIRF